MGGDLTLQGQDVDHEEQPTDKGTMRAAGKKKRVSLRLSELAGPFIGPKIRNGVQHFGSLGLRGRG